MSTTHSLHIPVMGIAFTIDTPLKVSQYGIDSVISLGDDFLLEELRKMYSEKFNLHFEEISSKIDDYRSKRITAYLNLVHELATDQFRRFQDKASETEDEINKYLSLLPSQSKIRQEFKLFMSNLPKTHEIKAWINKTLSMGSIDVNIMTKVDKENFVKGEKLPTEYNDAHAALRGYAKSNLSSSVIFSAGMNPRLYSYIEQFDDFYPDENGNLKKKIVLKVSDFRSAHIQGKFLAKKGLWVSEYRIESGLNCGGHAFATDGYLMGPILEEFKSKRQELIDSVHQIYIQSLNNKGISEPSSPFPIKITAQGGVGTYEEHQFLLDHYNIDSVGWGSPFLLVPEATIVDEPTLDMLVDAKEKDLYLSEASPLGVPFNNLRNSTKEREKKALADAGRPGSPCTKKFLALDKEHSEKGLCPASRKYQNLKIKMLKEEDLSPDEYQKRYDDIVVKECLCTGLSTPALSVNELDTKIDGDAVSICPGPNIAYFTKVMSLKEMTDHIYGRQNVISRTDRPNMFMKELHIYVEYLKGKYEKAKPIASIKEKRYLSKFALNLNEGINYYLDLFENISHKFTNGKSEIEKELVENSLALHQLSGEIDELKVE